jgi:uncharacterized membrane-anchored protein YhcB (DUF1043 family)
MNKLGNVEMENVQAIAWTVEIVTFIVAALIAWGVWKISKRAIKKNRQVEHTSEKIKDEAVDVYGSEDVKK